MCLRAGEVSWSNDVIYVDDEFDDYNKKNVTTSEHLFLKSSTDACSYMHA